MTFKPNLNEMMQFKKLFHFNKRAFFQTFSKNPKLGSDAVTLPSVWNNQIQKKLIQANRSGMHISMAINTIKGDQRVSDNVTKINALYIDVDDGKMDLQMLLSLSPKPHLVIKTSLQNYHAYWLVSDCEVGQFKLLQKALAAKFGTDASVCDLPRAMRMPGTYNYKYDPPYLARVAHIDNDRKPISVKMLARKLELNIGQDLSASAADKSDVLISIDDSNELQRIKAALCFIPTEDRWYWLRVGMAIHSHDQTECGYKLWNNWSKKSNSEKYDADDQRKTWEGLKAGGGVTIGTLFYLAKQYKENGALEIDESTLAQMFADSFKKELRYDRENKAWHHFTSTVWKTDSQAPIRMARRLVESLTEGANKDKTSSLKRYRTTAGFRAIVSHAELLPELQITSREFDQSSNLFAVTNGVIELKTGYFRPACASDLLRRHAEVEFDASALCPNWIKFLRSITLGNRNYYEHLRRTVGYIMFGHANEQVFFLLIGSGGNGKGVFSRALKRIFGDYGESVSPVLLTKAYSGSPNAASPALAQLHGARLVNCTELPTGAAFDEAFMKQYAGGDEISTRAIYGEQFTYKPEGKLLVSTNHIPELRADDQAMHRRMKVLPFDAVFRGEDVDPMLEEKLLQERSGILNWILKGAMVYSNVGLGSCEAVESLEEKMRINADSILAWLHECCEKGSDQKTQASLAYDSYLRFMRRTSRKPLTSPQFRANLEEKNLYAKRQKNANYFMGFRLLE